MNYNHSYKIIQSNNTSYLNTGNTDINTLLPTYTQTQTQVAIYECDILEVGGNKMVVEMDFHLTSILRFGILTYSSPQTISSQTSHP